MALASVVTGSCLLILCYRASSCLLKMSESDAVHAALNNSPSGSPADDSVSRGTPAAARRLPRHLLQAFTLFGLFNFLSATGLFAYALDVRGAVMLLMLISSIRNKHDSWTDGLFRHLAEPVFGTFAKRSLRSARRGLRRTGSALIPHLRTAVTALLAAPADDALAHVPERTLLQLGSSLARSSEAIVLERRRRRKTQLGRGITAATTGTLGAATPLPPPPPAGRGVERWGADDSFDAGDDENDDPGTAGTVAPMRPLPRSDDEAEDSFDEDYFSDDELEAKALGGRQQRAAADLHSSRGPGPSVSRSVSASIVGRKPRPFSDGMLGRRRRARQPSPG